MTILNHIWPWSRIAKLEAELAKERKFGDVAMTALLKIDPLWLERDMYEAEMRSPRLNTSNIKRANGKWHLTHSVEIAQ